MFWKRKPPSFRRRVEAFWSWWTPRAQEFFEVIEAGNCSDLQYEVGPQIAAIWDDFQWVFGPGPVHRGGHAFTVSGGGVLYRQFLAQAWAAAAPELEGWTFYGSRQPGDLSETMAIGIDGDNFVISELELTPSLDEEQKTVDVDIWHPTFGEVDERKREFALFLMLDEILGEFGTDQWLGKIEVVEQRSEAAVPALQMRDYLHDLEVSRGWKKPPPTDSYSTYRMRPRPGKFPRSDTIAGTTSNLRLIQDFFNQEGPLKEDPLQGSGAWMSYLEFPSSVLPPGGEAEFRGQIEDQLSEQLGAGGRVFGGAVGSSSSYIDLLLLDGDESLAAVRTTLNGLGLGVPCTLQPFTAKGRRIKL